jgi:hypothetical protein
MSPPDFSEEDGAAGRLLAGDAGAEAAAAEEEGSDGDESESESESEGEDEGASAKDAKNASRSKVRIAAPHCHYNHLRAVLTLRAVARRAPRPRRR